MADERDVADLRGRHGVHVGTSLPATGFTVGDWSTNSLDRLRAYRSRARYEEAGGFARGSGILLKRGSMPRMLV
jgi:hypothetical protein